MNSTQIMNAIGKLSEVQVIKLWRAADICTEVDGLFNEVDMADENLQVSRKGGSMVHALQSIVARADSQETGYDDAAILKWFETQLSQ